MWELRSPATGLLDTHKCALIQPQFKPFRAAAKHSFRDPQTTDMSAIERTMLKVHQHLREAGLLPRSALPPQLQSNRKQVKRMVGRRTYTTYKE